MKKLTAYEWCLEFSFRVLDGIDYFGGEDSFMLDEITEEEFTNILTRGVKIKKNSTPRKPEKFLELRMYGFVPYNISDKQKSIQFDHAKDEYEIMFSKDENYQNYLNHWKTVIMLNGGTSNEGSY